MTAPHDSREAVEAMAAMIDFVGGSIAPDGTTDRPAAMLRRLLAQREAAEQERDEARDDYEAATMRASNLEAALATARADALAEIAAREAAARCAAIEAAAAIADRALPLTHDSLATISQYQTATYIWTAIRALTPPASYAAALEAVRREERERIFSEIAASLDAAKPFAVRVHEGGGAEDVLMSLAVTMSKMKDAAIRARGEEGGA